MQHEKCGAKTKAGGRCGLDQGWGTGHHGTGRCKFHGGASPQAELSGQLEVARREAIVMGQPMPVDPHEAILECIAIARGEVAYASSRIAELQAEDAAAPVTTEVDRPRKLAKGAESKTERATEMHYGAPALNVWIRARREAMDRLVQYSATALRAGVEERQIRLTEQMAGQVAFAFRTFVRLVGLDPEAVEIRAHMRSAIEATREAEPATFALRRTRAA